MSELYHHGILGMKWGVRRYQNEDGTLTSAGKRRYSESIRSTQSTKPRWGISEDRSSTKPKWAISARGVRSTQQTQPPKGAIVEGRPSTKPKWARSYSGEDVANQLRRSSGSRKSETLTKARKENIDKLSNEDLKKYNERLNLEQNFARLTEGRVKQAKDWVAKTVVSGIVIGAVSQVSKQVVKTWLQTQFGIAG